MPAPPAPEAQRFSKASARAFGGGAFVAALLSAAAAAIAWPLHHVASIAIALAGVTIAAVLVAIWRWLYVPVMERFTSYASELDVERERFEALFRRMPDAGVIYGVDGIVLRGNAATVRLFGASAGSFVGEHFSEHIAPEDRAVAERSFALALEGRSVELEITFLNRQGERLAVWGALVPIIVAGEVRGVFGMAKDMRPMQTLEAQLRRENERFRSLFDISHQPAVQFDRQRRIRRVNAAFERLTGYTADELIGKTSEAFSNRATAGLRDDAYHRVLTGESFEAESAVQTKSGTTIAVMAELVPVTLYGEVDGYYVLMRDLTEARIIEHREEFQRRKMRELNRLATAPLEELNALLNRVIEFGRELLTADSGYVGDIVGDDIVIRAAGSEGEIAVGARIPVSETFARHLLASEQGSITINNVADSEFYTDPAARRQPWHSVVGALILVEGVRFGVLIFVSRAARGGVPFDESDVDFINLMAALLGSAFERDRRARTLGELAMRDPLTGLANRSMLAERLEREIARARRNNEDLGILYLDLDGFKPINDRLGHAAGDRVLVEIADRLRSVVRDDELVARIGGDEFVILLGNLRVDSLARCAMRVEEAIERPFDGIFANEHLSVSIGDACFGVDGNDATSMIAAADAKMYREKHRRKSASA